MRKEFYLLLLLTLLLSATTYAQKVSVDYDKQANFSSYKTYSWSEGTPAKNPLGHQRIIAGIDAQLAAKGWQKVQSDSDVVVIYSAATTTKTEINTFETGGPWGGYRWGWGGYRGYGGGSSTTTVQEIPVGHLVVDMADVKTSHSSGKARQATRSVTSPRRIREAREGAEKDVQEFPPDTGNEVVRIQVSGSEFRVSSSSSGKRSIAETRNSKLGTPNSELETPAIPARPHRLVPHWF